MSNSVELQSSLLSKSYQVTNRYVNLNKNGLILTQQIYDKYIFKIVELCRATKQSFIPIVLTMFK